ncbi:hypothetical protein NQ315_008630 [Exocentrus adspersus]|uniref:Caspase activity and apoptosis inhibitor 1 n=1 Tax=Exocentrus adspersus TaxID=1586481 RepID=A0AAV8W5U3_9CUCU|nr:hypothetical protein NQ315_008630 [Exocentrus adspersus]
MDSLKKRRDSKTHSKRDKKLKKLINKSDSDSDESEHELSYYLNDRVKLMKEVLKIIKTKKIKSMAPDCIKNLDISEINSMLLEELLGISNKRLKYIFNGQNLEEDSSSTDPEAEQPPPIDVISLDDITDDDFIINLDSDDDAEKKKPKKHKSKVKEEVKRKKVKKEKQDKADPKSSKKSKDSNKKALDEQNLMSVLELLELQARARAIRSQLALESAKKSQAKAQEASAAKAKGSDSEDGDAVIIESPKNIEIVITSSESENEDSNNATNQTALASTSNEKTGVKTTENGNLEEPSTCTNDKDAANSIECSATENGSGEDGSKGVEKSSDTGLDKVTEVKISTQPKSKITNIEMVILRPSKNAIRASGSETSIALPGDEGKTKENDTEKEKPSESDSQDKEVTAKEVSEPTSKGEEDGSVDGDGNDGIILNMEQSEIDCIICD